MIPDLAGIPRALISDACRCFVTTPTKTITVSETSTDTFDILVGVYVTTTTTTEVVATTAVVPSFVPEGYELVAPGINENLNCGWDAPGADPLIFGLAFFSGPDYMTALQGCAYNCSTYLGRT